MLAGILQAPSRLNPVASVAQATARRTYVLRRMRELGYLDDAAWQAAMDEPVARGLHGPRVQIDAPYIGEMVRIALFEKFGDRIYSEGFQVITTVDSRLQRAADVALRSAVLEYDRRHGWRGPVGQVTIGKEDTDEVIAAAIEERPVVGGLIPSIVVETRATEATVVARSGLRYRLGMDGIRWAKVGDATPKSPRDVMKIGDVVYVLPSGEGDGAACAIARSRRARSSRSIRTTARSSRCRAASTTRPPSSTAWCRRAASRVLHSSPSSTPRRSRRGFTPASVVLDAPVVYEAPDPDVGIGQNRRRRSTARSAEQEDWRPGNDSRPFLRPDAPSRCARALAQPRHDPRHAPDRRRLRARLRRSVSGCRTSTSRRT